MDSRLRRLAFLCVLLIGIAGCATAPVVDVDPNHGLQRVAVSTYSLVLEEMPGFLAPMMRDELVGALADRGAREVAADGDVEFRLRFEQVTLVAEDVVPATDRFEGTIAPEAATRFIAEAVLSAVPRGQSAAVVVGSISRVHAVSAGAYMHPRARGALRRGFAELLADFLEQATP
jgi:hypothetical protein